MDAQMIRRRRFLPFFPFAKPLPLLDIQTPAVRYTFCKVLQGFRSEVRKTSGKVPSLYRRWKGALVMPRAADWVAQRPQTLWRPNYLVAQASLRPALPPPVGSAGEGDRLKAGLCGGGERWR